MTQAAGSQPLFVGAREPGRPHGRPISGGSGGGATAAHPYSAPTTPSRQHQQHQHQLLPYPTAASAHAGRPPLAHSASARAAAQVRDPGGDRARRTAPSRKYRKAMSFCTASSALAQYNIQSTAVASPMLPPCPPGPGLPAHLGSRLRSHGGLSLRPARRRRARGHQSQQQQREARARGTCAYTVSGGRCPRLLLPWQGSPRLGPSFDPRGWWRRHARQPRPQPGPAPPAAPAPAAAGCSVRAAVRGGGQHRAVP